MDWAGVWMDGMSRGSSGLGGLGWVGLGVKILAVGMESLLHFMMGWDGMRWDSYLKLPRSYYSTNIHLALHIYTYIPFNLLSFLYPSIHPSISQLNRSTYT
jgi:hypothetical protein